MVYFDTEVIDLKTLFFIIVVSIAVSYGWGMRGMLIGGERGAVLPGALLGMFLALFSGNAMISEHFYIFAAAGALGMAYGGFEPYAETMSFILHHKEGEHFPKKGYGGLMLKGALWFGICGSVMGMAFSALSGAYYKPVSLVIFLALIPLMQGVGVLLFNKPYDKENRKFPKLYLSIESREEWGGNLIMLICFLIFALVNKDYYSVFFSLTGIVSGAIGWTIAITLYDFQAHPMKNGNYFFGKIQNYIDGWKIMEYSLGAFTGLCFAIFFFATKDTMLAERMSIAEANGGFWNVMGDKSLMFALITVLCMFLVAIQYIDAKPFNKVPFRFYELAERAILFALPMIGVMLGNEKSAEFTSFFLIVCFAAEKVIFERSKRISGTRKLLTNLGFGIVAIASLILQIFFKVPPIAYILFYTIYYILAENSTIYKKEFFGSRYTVNGYFLVQSIFLIAVVLFI